MPWKNVIQIDLRGGGTHQENKTKEKWIIYTYFKSCFYSTADSWDDERDFKQPKSIECHLQFIYVIGDDVVLKVWWYHLNMGPFRNFALSCLDIQIYSQSEMATNHV